MSKMMDNLARVQEEAQPAAAEKKPSLFVVREQPVGSASGGHGGTTRRKALAVWAVAAALLAGLGASFVIGQRSLSPQATAERVLPQQDHAAGEALALIRSGQLGEAKAALDRQLHARPGNGATLLNRAYVLKELGQAAEAEAILRVVVQSRPRDPVALNNLGALLLRMGRASEAETVLRRAVDLDPKAFEARVNLAATLERRRDWAGALKIFEGLLAGGEPGERAAQIRERVRRLRSLAVASLTPKEKL